MALVSRVFGYNEFVGIGGSCILEEDNSGNLIFTDAVTGTKTLAELAAGSAEVIAGTDNHLARYHNTGQIQQSTNIVVDDSDNISGLKTVSCTLASDSDFDLDDVVTTDLVSGHGQIIIGELMDESTATLRLEGTTLINIGSNPVFSTTKDTPNRINCYFDGGVLCVQNKSGDNKSIHIAFFGVIATF